MVVLVCGSREWKDLESILLTLLTLPEDTTVVHGGARGADRLAGEAADILGFQVVVFPAAWEAHGKAAGIFRNQQMLSYLLQARDRGEPVAAFAFHQDLANSRGTKDMTSRLAVEYIPYTLITTPWSTT